MTRAVDYHATKRGNSRRTFAFPHPETFHDISLFLAKNWNQIETHFRKSTYSRSVPDLTTPDSRAVKITAHQDLTVMLYRELSPYRFVVKTDVSRFYPSIYTPTRFPGAFTGRRRLKQTESPTRRP